MTDNNRKVAVIIYGYGRQFDVQVVVTRTAGGNEAVDIELVDLEDPGFINPVSVNEQQLPRLIADLQTAADFTRRLKE
jgi:hypothetical protein